MKARLNRILITAALLLPLYQPAAAARPAVAQHGEQTRDIESTEVTRSRRRGRSPRPGRRYFYEVRQGQAPRAGSRRPGAGRMSQAATTAATAFPVGRPPRDKTYATVGVTLWRVRPATEAELEDPKVTKERLEWDRQEHEVVATRISDEAAVADKDLIQMSVEYLPYDGGGGASGRAAYLYVINSEQFPDGSVKNSRLIFPTRMTYDGDNRVLPGKVVTLPDPRRPFRVGRSTSSQAQAFETYTVVLSPVPLTSELPQQALGRKAMPVPTEWVTGLERRWGGGEARADLRGGVGRARTQRELNAAGDTDASRSTGDADEDLTQDDSPPQTVFRKVVRPGTPLVVTIKLPFKEAAAGLKP